MASVNPTNNKELTSNNPSRRQPPKRPRNPNNTNQHQDRTHAITKRPITKPFQRKNDLYVTNKSSFNVQLKQCNELLQKPDINEVFLHSVGNAIARCINLALTLVQDSNGGLGYEANTSTIQMIDNLHPLNDDEDFTIQQRLNSCLHIRIFRNGKDLLVPAPEPSQN